MLPDTYRKVHASCKVATLTSRVFCNGERDGGSPPQPAKNLLITQPRKIPPQ